MRTRCRCQQARWSRVPSRDPGGAWDLTRFGSGMPGALAAVPGSVPVLCSEERSLCCSRFIAFLL